MNEDELQAWKIKFEEMGIQFICEDQPNTGPRIGRIRETIRDDQHRIWHAIGDTSVPEDTKKTLRQVLTWVARMGF